MIAETDAAALDAADPLADRRALFELPAGVIYLDGNSLGPLSKGVRKRMTRTLGREWGKSLIRAWNDHRWIDLPTRVGNRIAALIGAPPGTVTAADSTSLNVVKALSAALRLRPERKTILSDRNNFPTDLYMAQGLIAALGQGHTLKLVDPETVIHALDGHVAAVMLTEVDYRTGRLHDMAAITAAAHRAGALAIWDLAHSAGALPVDLAGVAADFAVGCGYKYLNGGPGAPAFIYVRHDHQNAVGPLLSGWMGHEAPFDFDLAYRPAPGVQSMRVGTPPILALAALDAALDAFEGVAISAIRAKSIALGDLFIREVETRCAGLGVTLASPREGARRGSQVSFRHAQGYAVMQALIAEGVIGDFRAPDLMRFGFAPLYVRYADMPEAAAILARVLKQGLWDKPKHRKRAKVT